MIGDFEVPRDQARAAVPTAFDLDAETPATASFRFYALHCPRVTIPGKVLENHGQFEIFAEVDTANESWSRRALQLYAFDFLTTSPELSAAALALGATNKAATLTRETETTDSGATLERWKFEAPDLVAEVEYVNGGGQMGGGAGDFDHWYDADDGFRRVEVESSSRNDQIIQQGGILRVDGTSRTGTLLANSCCTPWNGQTFSTRTDVWTGNQTLFR